MAKVLIADDSKTDRAQTVSVVKKLGHLVFEAESGEAAFEFATLNRPDLVILDVVMASGNGFQTCRRLKKDEKTKGISVILLTSKAGEADRTWGMNQGADAYLTKPLNEQELKNTLAALLK